MNRKRLLKKCVLLFLLFSIVQTTDYCTESVQAATAQEIQPMSDDYEWKYKTENGKRYKRLYNKTKHRWEGDWIPV